jgi:leucine dehydrogenase
MEIKDHSTYRLAPNSKEDSLMPITMSNLMTSTDQLEDVFQRAKEFKFGELHFKIDPETNLFAIVAIHSTKLGPAIGGCRCISYPSTQAAILDAIRLAMMMSYKAAICNLPHGGAKSVIIRPAEIKDRKAYFQSFGEFVNQLNGRYVAAVDSGTDVTDMDFISDVSSYVTCTSRDGCGDPSPFTAIGVKRGIEAAVKFKLGQSDLRGLHVAIQGAGHVGYYLAKELTEAGVRLTMTDVNQANLARCVEEFGVATVQPDEIYHVECDVFSPCALGASINSQTIKELKTKIVAGSANNQLKDLIHDDQLLFERGILYAPDFLINAGGLIYAACAYDHGNLPQAEQQIFNIFEASYNLFERAKRENKPTNYIAQIIAEEKLY